MWKELLLLLEGQPIHFPGTKTSYTKGILREKNNAIFTTSKAPIAFVAKYDAAYERENEMMAAHLRAFTFSHQIPKSQQRNMPPCPHCSAELVLLGEDMQ